MFHLTGSPSLMETAMDDRKRDSGTIAEEAVGEMRGSPTPDAVKDEAVTPTEEVIRQLANSAGPQAGMAAKTAEAVGERVGDARTARWASDSAVADHCSASPVSDKPRDPTAVYVGRRGFRPRLCRRATN